MGEIDVSGEIIKGVFVKEEESMLDKVWITFSNKSLLIEVNGDTDELIINLLDHSYVMDKSFFIPDWSDQLIGKKIIGNWVAKNQQGYLDIFSLGLDQFIPTLIISCQASQIYVGIVNDIEVNKK